MHQISQAIECQLAGGFCYLNEESKIVALTAFYQQDGRRLLRALNETAEKHLHTWSIPVM